MKLWRSLNLRLRHLRLLWSARRDSAAALRARGGRRILVLCHGNIYRSPFVEQRLRALLDDRWEIRSAGFHHRTGRSSAADYVAMARDYGVDLSGHRSRQVDCREIESADLVVIMDRRNHDELCALCPQTRGKIVWIGFGLRDGLPEVPDPWGQPAARTKAILARLNRATEALAGHLSGP